MKKIEINGTGVLVELWKRRDELTDIEVLKEAAKAIQRTVIAYESGAIRSFGRTTGSDELPQRP